MRPALLKCLFVCVPDVVGDARRTLLRYVLLWWVIRLLGYPTALVAQDGLERWPWRIALWLFPYNCLFIGGSTEWKMGEGADFCIREAKKRGKWVHVGRVNSIRRMRHFKMMKVDSVDGTSLTYAPDRDFWRFQKTLMQPALFTLLEE